MPIEKFSLLSIGLPNEAAAGETILLDKNLPIEDLLVQGHRPTRLQNGSSFFVVGLYSDTPFIVRRSVQREFTPNGQLVIDMPVHIIKVNPPAGEYKPLKLPAKVWEKVSDVAAEQKEIDRQHLIAALTLPTGSVDSTCWRVPVHSKIVSRFASPRTLPNGRHYYHSGVDLRGAVGNHIHAVAPGVVVLAEHMVVPGNNIIISHGGGLYSRYMHMSKFDVKVGDRVHKGETIGEVGATGRVQAPHLHWEVIWKGQHADPFYFFNQWKKICQQQSPR